jgi:hypothetical protein
VWGRISKTEPTPAYKHLHIKRITRLAPCLGKGKGKGAGTGKRKEAEKGPNDKQEISGCINR